MVDYARQLWLDSVMDKTDAIQLLGGSIAMTAAAIGTSHQAVSKWPDVLPRRIEDRVIAAIARRWLQPEAFQPDIASGAGPDGENPDIHPKESAHV